MARRRAAEVEGIRRSAVMAPLAQTQVLDVLEDYQAALNQLERMADALKRLTPAWSESRNALNELARILAD